MIKKLVLGAVLGVASFSALAYYGCDTFDGVQEWKDVRLHQL